MATPGFLVYLLVVLSCCFGVSQAELPEEVEKVIRKVNKDGPYIGVLVANKWELQPIFRSPSYQPGDSYLHVDYAGRRFHFGRIASKRAIFVMTGKGMINAAITTQIMCSFFDVLAIINYGLSANADSNLNMGDIVVPQFLAHTGFWNWQKYGDGPNDALSYDEEGDFSRAYGHLRFADYRIHHIGNDDTDDNFLNSVWFQAEEIFHFAGAPEAGEKAFWIPISQALFEQAKTLKRMALDDCANMETCLPRTPQVLTVHRGGSASMYIDNADYKEFLHSKFQVQVVDMESAALALITHQQNIPFIAFRAVNGPAGESSSRGTNNHIFHNLFIENCLKVLINFVKNIREPSKHSFDDPKNISTGSHRAPL